MSDARPDHKRAAFVDRTVRRLQVTDLYEALQVSPQATQPVIQAAYRVLARTAHPDVNVGADAQDRIRHLNAAYLVLSDPERRAHYDLERSRARRHERALSPVPHRTPMPPPHVRGMPSPERSALGGSPAPVLRSGPLLLLVIVAVLTTLVLVLVLSILDPVRGDVAVRTQTGSHSAVSF